MLTSTISVPWLDFLNEDYWFLFTFYLVNKRLEEMGLPRLEPDSLEISKTIFKFLEDKMNSYSYNIKFWSPEYKSNMSKEEAKDIVWGFIFSDYKDTFVLKIADYSYQTQIIIIYDNYWKIILESELDESSYSKMNWLWNFYFTCEWNFFRNWRSFYSLPEIPKVESMYDKYIEKLNKIKARKLWFFVN